MQDAVIITGILKNDHAAFELLVKKYETLVYATCYKCVKNQSDAEDLCQDVFLEVFRSLVHLKNKEDISGWMFRIAYSKSISFLRKKNPAKASSHHDPAVTANQIDASARHRNKLTPQKELEQKETLNLLFNTIDQLPNMQKKAFLMHKFEGFSHREICEELDLSQASVESLIYRAKVSLRKSLLKFFENYKS